METLLLDLIKMRQAQKEFFRYRHKKDLQKSIELEMIVDKQLEELRLLTEKKKLQQAYLNYGG
jgi:hypothetical protein